MEGHYDTTIPHALFCNIGCVCFIVKLRKSQVTIMTYDLQCLFRAISHKIHLYPTYDPLTIQTINFEDM